MKKIIATVLAMVMALALCTTAFATGEGNYDVWTAGELKARATDSTVVPFSHDVSVTAVAGSETKTTVTVDHYIVAAYAEHKWVKCTADTDGAVAVYVKGTDPTKTAPLYYLVMTDVTGLKASVFTNLTTDEKACGKNLLASYKATDTYYATYNSDGDVTAIYKADADNGTALYVDGKLVKGIEVSATPIDHNFNTIGQLNKDDSIATVKCSKCGAEWKYTTSYFVAKNAADMAPSVGGGYAYTDNKAATDTKTDGTTSPKTFDAGIAMYVGMALTSVAGSAVVIGKKKEF